MKIKKSVKKVVTPPSDVAAVVDKIANSTKDDDIIPILNDLPAWRYQRADLHAWVPALDRFDDVLANIIQSYDLGKLQTNDFTPKTKELLLGILRLTRLMLENCTSRKLYASYDRLADLLFTTDIDVLHSTLLLLLRPGQQYGSGTPMEAPLMKKITDRLLALTKGWEQYHDAGFDVVQVVTLDKAEPASTKIVLQFYPLEGSSSSITTLELDVDQLQTPDQIVEVAERHKISVDDQLNLLNKARVLTADKQARQQLFAIRLLAVATYVYYTPDDTSLETIFLYETSLITQTAALLVPGRGVTDTVLSAAIYVVDACAHHRGRLTEVVAAIGANVNHGILISIFRDTVRRLTGNEDVLYEVVDALMGLVAYVATSPPHSNQIIGAGIIPLLLEFPKTKVDKRVNYIARTMGLIDAVIYSAPQGLTAFGAADGISTLVKTVKAEIQNLLDSTLPEPTYALSEETIQSYYTIPIRSTLRSIQRMMQMSGGAEGMRNLVDSDLPKLLKQIFIDAPRFGPRVFSLAMNTMASFVHNEPTSLSVLQELGLPQALYTQLEQEYSSTHEIVSAIPHAIGAICLNQAGIDLTLAHPSVIEKLVTLSAASDHAHHVGQSLDELVRHHPPLRSLVLAGLLRSLQAACDEGAAFAPANEEERKKYLLAGTDVIGNLDEPAENEPLKKLVMILNVLQGVLRNSTLAKEFIEGGGLDRLLDIADLPCIPMQAGHAPSGISVATITVFSTLGEHDQGRIAKALVQSARTTMDKVSDLWRGEATWDDGLGDKLPILRGLVIRLAYLSNFFAGVSTGPSKTAIPLLKSLGELESFIEDIGLLHRKTMMAVAMFRVKEAPEKDGSPEDIKGSAGKYLSTRLYSGLTKMFKSFARLLFFKRTPEPAHRAQAEQLATKMTNILIGHCEFAKTIEGSVGVCYNTIALGACLLQLFDDRGPDGHLHMVLFIKFEKKGGVARLLDLVTSLLDNADRPDLEGAEKLRAATGVIVALETLGALVRPKAIMANPQTHILQQRTEIKFSPTEMFIRIRRDIFPHAKRVWESAWLQEAPVKVAQKGIMAFLTIMEGKDEKPPAPIPAAPTRVFGMPPAPQPVAARAPLVADPAGVSQLVDMGFARGSAEQAMIRGRNNVAAATEMLLSMPHVFENAAAAATVDRPPLLGDQFMEVLDQALANFPTTETAPATTADDNMEVDESPTPPPTESAEAIKKALDDLREQARPEMPKRAMALLSGEVALMFDLIPAFPKDESALTLLLKSISADESENLISNKLRLFSVLSVAHEIPELNKENGTLAYSIIQSLPIEMKPRPKWLTSLLCFAETVMVLSINVKTVKIGDEPEAVTEIARIEQQERLITACLGIIAEEATQADMVTAYRCLVVISKYNTSINFTDCLAPFKTKLDQRLSTCHQLLAMILRHGFEDRSTLDEVMQSEIRTWFKRDKVTEVGHLVSKLRQATSRHSDAFVDAIEKECALVDPNPAAGVYHIRAKAVEKKATLSDPFTGSPSNPNMELLVKELGVATKATLSEESTPEGYTGLIFSLLTEVVGSYNSAKKAFMDVLRDTGLNGPKARNEISPIVNDLVGCVELGRDLGSEGQKGAKPSRRMVISGWATSMLVALCSDISTASDVKSVSEDLTTIRRTVLDAIIKALKESSSQDANIRYGKLWAIGQLIYRLLTAKLSISPRHDDSSLLLAKAMVERNVVGLITDAMGGVDLNFPNIKIPLASLLKALDHLSKISIKWNKVEKAGAAGPSGNREGSPSSSGSDSEMDMDGMDGIDEDAPDLYRNSALGILGGEVEDESGDEDEDEEDDMLDIYDENDMEDDDEADTDPSDEDEMDEDEDMDEDPEEWTDDEGEDGNLEREVIIDTEDPLLDDEEDDEGDVPFPMEDDGAPVIPPGLEDYLDNMLGDEDDEEGLLDGMDGMDEMDDMDEMDEMDGMDGPDAFELEDEEEMLDEMEEAGDAEITIHPPSATAGHWGWATDPRAGRQDRPRSRLIDTSDPMAALFGPSRSSSQSLVQHPLLTNPAYAEALDQDLQSAFAMVPHGAPPGTGSMAETMGPDAARLVENILARHRDAGRTALNIGMASTPDGGVAIEIGGRRYRFPHPSQQTRTEAAAAADIDISAQFIPKPTMPRWLDEMAVCGDDSVKLVNHIINRLLPEAKVTAAAEAEKAKKAEQEEEEDEERAQEAAREMHNKKFREEQAEREANALAAAAVALPESRIPTPLQDVEMEAPVVAATSEQPAPESATAENETGPSTEEVPTQEAPIEEPPVPRVLISIHGRDVDITGTGIDLEFLQALPDEMRADVVEQHMREHNRNRDPVADSSLSSQISPEFLEALPDEIRSEIMLQERMERARNARAQADTRQTTAPGLNPPADVIGGLGRPETGAAIRARLMRQRPDFNEAMDTSASRPEPSGEELRALADSLSGAAEFPSVLGEEFRDLFRSLRGVNGAPPQLPSGSHDLGRRPAATGEPPHKRHKRDAVQLLDKPGVASLVRLLFFPEAFKREYLYRVLLNLCENSTTRSDLLNLLISVVQDGTGDLLLVDKSFSQMSLKPGATPKSTPKTPKMPETPIAMPQPAPSGLFAKLQADHIPTFIAERSFDALSYIVMHNTMAVNYFLTEHEQPVGLRKPLSKKGKGKEKLIPQTKFPIVVLMGFLERSVLLKAPMMMESFTMLLASITKPLATLKATETKEVDEIATPPEAAPAMEAPWAPGRELVSIPIATPAKTKVGESSNAAASSSTLTRAPVIPDSVLKLVVNCLTIGECSSRTFSYALSIMQNLSTVAGAKITILSELRDRAQLLGGEILGELQELNTTLLDHSTEISTASLAKFTPAHSSQAQLLRLLKTIDYLHSEKVDSDPPGETLTEQEKAIAQTFDSFDFDAMWKQLSECLSTVDARGSTDQISAVLLPLVEALMVICKYRRPEARESRSPSVPPSTIDETDSLFVTFTTTHRKVLNAIVRTNPGLLSGSFSLLVRNPRVLEFDNKRNWFLQKLKRKRDQPAHSPVLHLNIRRQYVFEDSFRALERRTGNEVKYGKLSVKFYNEDGIDAGGVTREWYSVLAQQIFDPNFALFEPCAADAQTYQPNKASGINGDHLAYFKFVGRVIGKAVFDGRLLDAYFSRAFYKQILGKTVDMRDLESIDPEYHKSLQWMLDNDITDVIDQEFTIEDDQFGEKKVVELKEGGAEISVTEENKEEYVRLVVGYRVENSIKDQIKSFLNGFYEVIPRKLVQIFEADQLELLISGITSVDVDELKNATQMSGWKAGDPEVSWFWRALRSFSQEERARFLMFVTSSSRVPLGGFMQLQGASGIQPFQLQKLYSKEGSLPQASTCFNLLLLPKYETYEQLREKLQFAIYETGGFGKA